MNVYGDMKEGLIKMRTIRDYMSDNAQSKSGFDLTSNSEGLNMGIMSLKLQTSNSDGSSAV